MSTQAPTLSTTERAKLEKLGWDVDAAHCPVPKADVPKLGESEKVLGAGLFLKLHENRENAWMTAAAETSLLDVRR
jgi:hypothetical protein